MGVVRGQRDDGLTALAGGDIGRHQTAALKMNGHRSPIDPEIRDGSTEPLRAGFA
jgi:hypothetical protein